MAGKQVYMTDRQAQLLEGLLELQILDIDDEIQRLRWDLTSVIAKRRALGPEPTMADICLLPDPFTELQQARIMWQLVFDRPLQIVKLIRSHQATRNEIRTLLKRLEQ